MISWLSRIKEWNSDRLADLEARRWRKWEVSDTGISVSRYQTPTVHFSWNDIEEIVAFKRDLYIHDQICLGISIKGQDTFIPLEEDNACWPAVVQVLEEHFTLPENWQELVMQPPFGAEWTLLWPNPSFNPDPRKRGPVNFLR